jgi:hypothetical protein
MKISLFRFLLTGKLKYVAFAQFLLSVLFTFFLIYVFWGILNPAGFWEKLVLSIISAVGGIILFVVINLLISVIVLFVLMHFIKKKIKRTFESMTVKISEDMKKDDAKKYK